MNEMNSIRVLWLLNHTTLRAFELAQLNRLGIKEIFTPKFFPLDEGNLSANIDFSFDQYLTIPKPELDILNSQNWYENPTVEAWEIANKYFDVAVIGFFPEQIQAATAHFKGAIIMRAFGLAIGHSYTDLLYELIGPHGIEKIKKLQNRFWFGAGYEHLHEVEGEWLQARNCYLPVGLKNIDLKDEWVGDDKRILFVCPRINTSLYFKNIYQKFVTDFSEFSFTIAGAQPVPVCDDRVIGFVSATEHQANMRNHRVMFYHSTEPYHIHFHPFEAIRAGMPLVFMAGGLLDKIGGVGLWGRCKTIRQAKRKIKQVLNDRGKLIKKIQQQQVRLLDCLAPDYCTPHFEAAYKRIIQSLPNKQVIKINKAPNKIAVILPVEYRGGSLRGTISLINSLIKGADFLKDDVEVVFAHLDVPDYNSELMFADLNAKVTRRAYKWKTLNAGEAKRAMSYAGHSEWNPKKPDYDVPDDGINQFVDCDLWIIISDRLARPLLPIKPYVLMVYDYIQRYVPFLSHNYEQQLFSNAQGALCILTTTQFTADDAKQYAGLKANKIFKMPMLVPDFKLELEKTEFKSRDYFIWTTNAALHKNHHNTFQALKIYFEDLEGKLDCHITGVGSNDLLEHYPELNKIIKTSKKMKNNIRFCRELSDAAYKIKLKEAAFLFHSALVDNGTFTVIEAAQSGTPSLSSDYPPMREIDNRFNLELTWMDSTAPENMAFKLKEMEKNYIQLKEKIVQKEMQQFMHTHDEEVYYWEVIKSCL